MLVPELLATSAKKSPNKIALSFGNETITYGALQSQVELFAAGLRSFGIKDGDFVGIHLPNHPMYVVAYFGIMRAGGIMVPINPLFKSDEILHIATDSNLKAIVTLSALVPIIQGVKNSLPHLAHIFVLGDAPTGTTPFTALFRTAPLQEPTNRGTADVAACLYTSGTTGRPKGALLTHQNLTFDCSAAQEFLQDALGQEDRFLAVLPLFHSYAEMVTLLLPLSIGASMVILAQFRPDEVLRVIAEEKVTILVAVPAMFAAILMTQAKDPNRFDLTTLRYCVSGGAAMPVDIMQKFEHLFNAVILEGNGPTEASPVAYVNPPLGIHKAGSVGLPLPGVTVEIHDAEDKPLPQGEMGEICIAGKNVMQGYLNRPDETAETLKNGFLHTGDIGFIDEDGYVFIVDRQKDLVIVGGLNVYPREVEEVLYRHPKIADCAVLGEKDSLRGESVKAFVVLKEGQTATAQEIIHYSREHLANYKCPRIIEFRDDLPRSASGKVLKRALRVGY